MARKTVPLSVMQARARAKGYRLKHKGASAEAIAAISPVRPWAEVKAMTAGEKISYRAKLKKFTSRESKVTVYKGGGAVYTSTLDRQERAIDKINRARERELKRVNAIKVNPVKGAENIYSSVGERQRERSLEERDYTGKKTGRKHEFIGDLYGVSKVSVPEVPPREQGQAERRLRMFMEMAGRNYQQRRQSLKENVVTMLDGSGAHELGKAVDGLTDDQFDVLTQRTNFMDELKTVYARYVGYKEDSKKGAEREVSLDEMAAKQDMAYALVQAVQNAVPGE